MNYYLLFGFLRGSPREIACPLGGKDVISWGKFVSFVVIIKSDV